MAKLIAGKRRAMPQSEFALPGKRFPLNDPTHARLAISGATRSQRAGKHQPGNGGTDQGKGARQARQVNLEIIRGSGGRIRSAENAETICTMIAGGWSLRQIAVQFGCVETAIRNWRDQDPAFEAQYEAAKVAQMDHFAEELLEISDDGSNDWMEREGLRVIDAEHVARSRLRVDTRKWLMGKMAPKRFGDKQLHEHSGKVEVDHALVDERRKRARAIIDAAFHEVGDGQSIEDGRPSEAAE